MDKVNRYFINSIITKWWMNDELIKYIKQTNILTLKHRETHGCVVSTVATDALVLKHQAISILSTD